jgi:hypothetical protein
MKQNLFYTQVSGYEAWFIENKVLIKYNENEKTVCRLSDQMCPFW